MPAHTDVNQSEQELKSQYYLDRGRVSQILRECVTNKSDLKAVERFWWYRGEDEEMMGDTLSMREKLKESA